MKGTIPQIKTSLGLPFVPSAFTLLALTLVCSGLVHVAQAVNPPPDGGYAGGNTAEGQSALLSLSTGGFNTAVGFLSLRSDSTTGFNTAIGAGTLLANTADQNTATGAGALLSNTTASGNTAYGAFALFSNTTGGTLGNVQGTDVGPNVAVGSQALQSNTIAGANTAVGYQALHNFVSGPVGFEQIGTCTAVGFQALANANGAGVSNSGFGHRALFSDTTGQINTATGVYALVGNLTGDGNTANGFIALQHNTTGGYNTAIGANALGDNTTGMFNVAVGYAAGQGVMTGNNNICIGVGAGAGDTSDTIVIGHGQTTTYIAGISDTTLGVGSQVLVESDGHLGVATSSRRFKENIQPIEDKLSEALFLLNPVAFRYKKDIDPKGTRQLGLVAEEVEKVNPELVVPDKEGKPYTVRYDQVNAMLLNEFLKEHKKVQQLEVASDQQRNDFEATIVELRKEIAGIVARSRDQEEKIQKVSAQVELNKTVSRTVANK
jgi:trimeric autotransporter adhesin